MSDWHKLSILADRGEMDYAARAVWEVYVGVFVHQETGMLLNSTLTAVKYISDIAVTINANFQWNIPLRKRLLKFMFNLPLHKINLHAFLVFKYNEE